jgi:hypothetical protein
MDSLLNQYYWMRDNYVELLTSLAILMISLQGIVRLTPTKKDDGAVEKIGEYLTALMKFLKIPNVKREDGKLIAGVHEEKKE